MRKSYTHNSLWWAVNGLTDGAEAGLDIIIEASGQQGFSLLMSCYTILICLLVTQEPQLKDQADEIKL